MGPSQFQAKKCYQSSLQKCQKHFPVIGLILALCRLHVCPHEIPATLFPVGPDGASLSRDCFAFARLRDACVHRSATEARGFRLMQSTAWESTYVSPKA